MRNYTRRSSEPEKGRGALPGEDAGQSETHPASLQTFQKGPVERPARAEQSPGAGIGRERGGLLPGSIREMSENRLEDHRQGR